MNLLKLDQSEARERKGEGEIDARQFDRREVSQFARERARESKRELES